MVYDGVSFDLLLDELATFYDAARTGRTVKLPPPLQYGDYVLWRDARDRRTADEGQLDYWREQLAGLRQLTLPCARRPLFRRALVQATRLGTLPFAAGARARRWLVRARGVARTWTAVGRAARPADGRIPIDITRPDVDALSALARAEHVTLYAVLLSAVALALSRAAGKTDIAVATVVANRTRPELQEVMGYMGNTVVLPLDLAGDPTFRALVGRVGDVVTVAQAHADVPFSTVSRAVTGAGELPLEYRLPVAFQLLEQIDVVRRLASVDVRLVGTMARQRSLRLAVRLALRDGELSGTCRFDPRLYERQGGANLIERFLAILHAAVENPDRPLSTLTGTSPARRRRRGTAP